MPGVEQSGVAKKSKTKRRLLAGISMNVLVLGIVSLLTDASSEMIYPIMPLFLSAIGATGLVIGLIEGASETTASFLKVVSGWYSDKFDRRKPFITGGYGLSTLMKPLLIWATTPLQVLGIRISERVGKGIRTAPRDALIADSTASDVRGKAYGFHKAMDSTGAVLGPVITLIIILIVVATEMKMFRLIFAIAVIPAVIAVLVILLFVREKEKSSKPVSTRTFRKGLKGLGRPFWLLMAVVVTFYIGEISYAFFILRAEDVNSNFFDRLVPSGVDPALVQAIVLYILYNVVFVVTAIPAGNLSDRLGRKPVIMAAFAIFVATGAAMAYSGHLAILAAGFILFGVYKGASEGVFKAYVTDVVPGDLKGTALGAFHTSVGLVMLPGGIIAGYLWDSVGHWATFAYGAVMAIIAMVMLFFLGLAKVDKVTRA
jgi:MFS family permease